MKVSQTVADLKLKAARELLPDSLGLISRITECVGKGVNSLAFDFPGLDDIPVECVHALSHIWVNGPSNAIQISQLLGEDSGRVDDYLEDLSRYGFIESGLKGHGITKKGSAACIRIVRNVISHKCTIMEGLLEHLNRLHERVGGEDFDSAV